VPVDQRELERRGYDLSPWIPPTADILHAHTPLRTPPACPHLVTIHGNARPGRAFPANTVFVSADHARRHGSTTFVYNGLDPAEYHLPSRKSDYDLFLGRLHRIKGYRWAIAGAKRLRRKLIVAGGWRPSLSRYVRYAGEVDGLRKTQLLADARCLWMPALWDEPFGLTSIEALASGTPVLGTRRGALPEIVSADVGALGDTLEDLVRLRDSLDRIDPAACRALVEQRFTHLTMAEAYSRLYRTQSAS
jgi:glycosyltransferase involved in cell wall biosynthesis